MNEILNIIPAKYHSLAVALIFASPYLTRALHSLMNGGGLRGVLGAIWLGTNTPKNVSTGNCSPTAAGNQTGFIRLPLVLLTALFTGIFAVLLIAGCAHIQPGNDPLLVNVERTETIGKDTFDMLLGIDNSQRDFYAQKAPAFHAFCEWLRQPQSVPDFAATNGTVTLPRCSAMLLSLDNVKLEYKSARASSNEVFTALQTVTSAMAQANAWLSTGVATNSTPKIQ